MENYIPKIRFKGTYDENGKWVEFTHPWKQRKLGNACQITMGQSPDSSTYSEEPSDYILVQGNADLKEGWVEPRIWTTQKTKTAQAGDLIMSVRAPAGAMGKTAYDVVLGRGVAGIKGNEFVYQSLVRMAFDAYWKKLVTGSTFESINSDVLKNAEMSFPQDIEEQSKIGTYFSNLDHLITLHQRKCDLYQQAKQSMMEKLFSNNVDWEEKQLGKILIRNPKSNIGVHETQQMKSGDIPYFTSGEKIFYINDFLVKGENIFVNDGGVADIKYYNGKANYSDHILSLKNIDNSICLQFVYQSLLSKIKIINDKLFHGLGLKNLSKKDFMNFTISIPDIEEQIKIANMLSKYDELIAISKNQLNTLQTLKKGLLQQMFV